MSRLMKCMRCGYTWYRRLLCMTDDDQCPACGSHETYEVRE